MNYKFNKIETLDLKLKSRKCVISNYFYINLLFRVLFLLTTITTSTTFINDRTEGLWDRSFVAGIKAEQMLLAHSIINIFILIIQCLEIIFFSAFLFGISNKGNNLTVAFLLVLQALSGMFCGLCVSVFCEAIRTTIFVVNGVYISIFLLCGNILLSFYFFLVQ